jgi:hypothetical protein
MVVIRADGQLHEIILVTCTMNINSVKTHNEVQAGNKWDHEESKQPVRNQNGKTVERKKRLETFHQSTLLK